MNSGDFSLDEVALLTLVVGSLFLLLWITKRKEKVKATLFFATALLPEERHRGWRARAAFLPRKLLGLALLFFLVAFVDPHYATSKASEKPSKEELISLPTEGIAIYLVLDHSGSMKESVAVATPGGIRNAPKIEWVKQLTSQFIQGDPSLGLSGRSDDMIGLVTFARTAEVLSPLTLDHEAVLRDLSHFEAVSSPKEDGTAIGYALFKTVSLIAATRHFSDPGSSKGLPPYDVKNTVIILLTDGLQNPNPEDADHPYRSMSVEEAGLFAKEHGVRLYLVDVEPTVLQSQHSFERQQLEKAAQDSSGGFFVVDSTHSLLAIYQEIDRLEKSRLPQERPAQANVEATRSELAPARRLFSFYPYLIAAGMTALALSVLLETTLLRRTP